MKKIFLLAGSLLVFLSIFLTVKNLQQSQTAKGQTEELLQQLPIVLEENPTPESTLEMAASKVDGMAVIGTLEIPVLNKTLPVLSDCTKETLEFGPCVYSGSYHTDNLIIAGHSYRAHFGALSKLQDGDVVSLKAVDGNEYTYTVTGLETIAGEDIDAMISGDWDMTLFTCTWDSASRVTVRLKKNI